MKTKLPTEWQELSDQLGFQEFTPIQTQLFEPLLAGLNSSFQVQVRNDKLNALKRGQKF
ncbi:ATP-dependent RNA helicase [Streptococcus pneumoniae]|nr:ATP-dependent RNA helicase [Streptococcus pneumoniae]